MRTGPRRPAEKGARVAGFNRGGRDNHLCDVCSQGRRKPNTLRAPRTPPHPTPLEQTPRSHRTTSALHAPVARTSPSPRLPRQWGTNAGEPAADRTTRSLRRPVPRRASPRAPLRRPHGDAKTKPPRHCGAAYALARRTAEPSWRTTFARKWQIVDGMVRDRGAATSALAEGGDAGDGDSCGGDACNLWLPRPPGASWRSNVAGAQTMAGANRDR